MPECADSTKFLSAKRISSAGRSDEWEEYSASGSLSEECAAVFRSVFISAAAPPLAPTGEAVGSSLIGMPSIDAGETRRSGYGEQ
jgi:hypothetical protein